MIKIIISPAKKMNIIDEYDCTLTQPVFMEETRLIQSMLKEMAREDLKKLWQCSDKLADLNYERLHTYNLNKNLTLALIAYEGIQYQYMAPHIFSDAQWNYVSEHLRILSGFYGILAPTDGVIPYRLEMQAKLKTDDKKDLYQFWENKIYDKLVQDTDASDLQILNLASAEYSKAVLPYIAPPVSCVTCVFGEETNGKVKVKGTQAKMARGEMVRWMAENQVKKITGVREFDRLGYAFSKDLSNDSEYIFLKTKDKKDEDLTL